MAGLGNEELKALDDLLHDVGYELTPPDLIPDLKTLTGALDADDADYDSEEDEALSGAEGDAEDAGEEAEPFDLDKLLSVLDSDRLNDEPGLHEGEPEYLDLGGPSMLDSVGDDGDEADSAWDDDEPSVPDPEKPAILQDDDDFFFSSAAAADDDDADDVQAAEDGFPDDAFSGGDDSLELDALLGTSGEPEQVSSDAVPDDEAAFLDELAGVSFDDEEPSGSDLPEAESDAGAEDLFAEGLDSTDDAELMPELPASADELDGLLGGSSESFPATATESLDDVFGGADADSAGLDDLLSGEALPDGGLPSEGALSVEGPAALPGAEDELDELMTGSVPEADFDDLGFDDLDLGGSGASGEEASTGLESPGSGYSTEPVDLTDDDLRHIQKRMLLLTPKVQEAARILIVEGGIEEGKLNQLIRMLLANEKPDAIKLFLENATGESLEEDLDDIYSMPESSSSPVHSETFQNMLPALRVASLFLGLIGLGLLVFFFFVKPRIQGHSYFTAGLSALEKGNFQGAEQNFNRGEEKLGKKLEWYNRYGMAYRAAAEYPRAIKKFKDGLELDSDDFQTRLNLAETYTMAGEYDEARKSFNRMLQADPDNASVLERLGDLFVTLGDRKKQPRYYEEARVQYEKIVNKQWDNLNGQFKLMRVFIRQDALKKVQLKAKHIERIDSGATHTPIMTEQAAFYQRHNLWRESGEILKKLWENEKNHSYAPTCFYFGRLKRHQENYPDALYLLDLAVKNDPKNPVYQNEKGEVHLLTAKPDVDKAQLYFQEAIRLKDDYYKPYINLGHVYYKYRAPGKKGDLNLQERFYASALQYYGQAEQRIPVNFDDKEFFYNLGWLLYRKKQVEEALLRWKKVYDHNPFHPVVSFAMGNAYLHLKKDELAQLEFDKVVSYYSVIEKNIRRVNPNRQRDKHVLRRLSWAYNNLGVALQQRKIRTGNVQYERDALLAFYKSRELAEKLEKYGYQYAEYNISALLRDKLKLGLSIAPEQSGQFQLPQTMEYELQ